jgi:sugar transferase
VDFDRWMELDLEYIDTWSPMLDLKILLKTVPAVLCQGGVALSFQSSVFGSGNSETDDCELTTDNSIFTCFRPGAPLGS